MFTGIVRGVAKIKTLERKEGLTRFALEKDPLLFSQIEHGASVAIDGVCLTVADCAGQSVHFDVMMESLRLTTLGNLDVGSSVNIERSARYGDEIGGHEISGHVDGTAEITAISTPANNHIISLRLPPASLGYIFLKGYIGIDGASLTVAEVDKTTNTISIYLIPETLRLTTLGTKKVGDKVNFELDRKTQAIVDTVRLVLAEQKQG